MFFSTLNGFKAHVQSVLGEAAYLMATGKRSTTDKRSTAGFGRARARGKSHGAGHRPPHCNFTLQQYLYCHRHHHHPERETIMPIIILLITQGDCLQFETAWNPFWTIFSQYWMRETLPPPLLVWKESPISSIYWPQTSAEPDQRSPQLTRGKNDVCSPAQELCTLPQYCTSLTIRTFHAPDNITAN